jgi:hypothetical protein
VAAREQLWNKDGPLVATGTCYQNLHEAFAKKVFAPAQATCE